MEKITPKNKTKKKPKKIPICKFCKQEINGEPSFVLGKKACQFCFQRNKTHTKSTRVGKFWKLFMEAQENANRIKNKNKN